MMRLLHFTIVLYMLIWNAFLIFFVDLYVIFPLFKNRIKVLTTGKVFLIFLLSFFMSLPLSYWILSNQIKPHLVKAFGA